MLVSGTLRAFFSLYNISISKSEPGIISEFSLLIFALANMILFEHLHVMPLIQFFLHKFYLYRLKMLLSVLNLFLKLQHKLRVFLGRTKSFWSHLKLI